MIHIEKTTECTQALRLVHALRELDAYYPDISHWYVNTVVPGIVLGNDTLLLAQDGPAVVGFCLGKHTSIETKLRCIRVLPQYQNNGVGLKLIEAMFAELQDERPHCTVAEELIHHYSRIFVNRYGFRLNQVEKGLYRTGKLEYCFN